MFDASGDAGTMGGLQKQGDVRRQAGRMDGNNQGDKPER